MGHGHGDRRSYRNDPYASRGRGREPDDDYWEDRPPPARRAVSWLAILIGLVVWSGVVFVGYLVIDVILSWLATNSGAVLQTGKDAGETLGLGNEVGVAVDGLSGTGIIGQTLAILQAILLPAAIVIWVLGAAAIFVLPRLLRRYGRRLLYRH